MKRIITSLLLLFLCFPFTSCYKNPVYSIESVHLGYLSSASGQPTLTDSTSIHWENFGLLCSFEIIDHTAVNSSFGYSYSHFRNYVTCRDPITKIYITADVDFDDEHPAGSVLNELFYYRPSKFTESIALSNNGDAPEFTAEDSYGYPDTYFPYQANFILTKPPNFPKSFTFQFKAIKESGDEMRSVTNRSIFLE